MRIINIEKSPVKNKRYRVYLDNGNKYDFGLDTGKTFIDHHNEELRQNYLKRHLANPIEKELINNLIPSPALFSAVLLWGPYKTLTKNMQFLDNLFKNKML